MQSRYRKKYEEEVRPVLMEEFNIKNTMATPRLGKIIVNIGIGDLIKNKEGREALISDIAAICGQKPSLRQARISVAAFGIRRGMTVGLTATLRGDRMYDFFDRLVNITLPRLRDFRGVKIQSFDKIGNYTLGFSEHTVFPEVDLSKSAVAHGMEVTIVTTANEPKAAKRLLELLGMPFEKKEDKKK